MSEMDWTILLLVILPSLLFAVFGEIAERKRLRELLDDIT